MLTAFALHDGVTSLQQFSNCMRSEFGDLASPARIRGHQFFFVQSQVVET
jgi:hypothetical protein